jgi:hypothetical protein
VPHTTMLPHQDGAGPETQLHGLGDLATRETVEQPDRGLIVPAVEILLNAPGDHAAEQILGDDDLANGSNEQSEFQCPMRAKIGSAVVELTHRPPLEPMDGDEAAANEIERVFQGMLIGVRRLPRSQRPAARRSAREWRQAALAELREKRVRERSARIALQKLQAPAP